MKRRSTLPALIATAIALLAITASAAVPQLINYQGRLTNGVGVPLDTTVALTFEIYADSNGVIGLWDETHPSVVIDNGLFQVLLGSVKSMGQDVFTGEKRWLRVLFNGAPATGLIPIVSSAYAYRANVTDTAALAKSVTDNSITSAKIQNGTISFADIGQNSATNGQVMKWNGSAWTAQADGTGSNASGWVDNGTVIGLLTATDTVSLNSALRLGKLNVGGNMSLTAQSSIYWGTDSTYIKGFSGGDMTLQGEDIFAKTTGSIYFADVVAGNFTEIDNANKLVGVGTTAPDERLQVENDAASGRSFLQLETSHATNFGETGIRFKTPQNTWHLRMDDYTNNNIQDGALGLRSQVGVEAMTWLEGGNVGVGTTNPLRKLHVSGSTLITDSLGIGTTNPTKKLHVYGSALIKDTLYAGAINPSLMSAAHLPDEPGVASNHQRGVYLMLSNNWRPIISREITVPAAGYVVALGHGSAWMEHAYGDFDAVEFAIDDDTIDVAEYHEAYFNCWTSVGSGTYGMTLSPEAIFRVDAAGTYKYYLVGKTYGPASSESGHSELILFYVPTAYGTASTFSPGTDSDVSTSELKARDKTISDLRGGDTDYAEELRVLREKIESLEKKLNGIKE